MIIGYIKKFNLIYIKLIIMQVGTLIGIFLKAVNLLFIKKNNTMIGIVIVGINLIMKMVQQKVKLENYQ